MHIKFYVQSEELLHSLCAAFLFDASSRDFEAALSVLPVLSRQINTRPAEKTSSMGSISATLANMRKTARAQLTGARGPQTPATFGDLLVNESAHTPSVDHHASSKAPASPIVR